MQSDRPVERTALNAGRSIDAELEDYVTKRLLAFYGGLLERGQITKPKAGRLVSEDPVSHCTADVPHGPSRPR